MKYFIFVFCGLLSLPALANPSSPRGDGRLRLYNYHLNEFAEFQFREGDRVLPEGLAQARKALRSRGNQEIIPIALELLDLIDYLQDHFAADTIEIISGYRDREFNTRLVREGRKVSPVSLHTMGQALDIHLDEVREETLRDYLIQLKLGGVGYYGPLDFVHVDMGPVKQWEEPLGARKLIGVLQPRAPIQLSSDKNDYLPGETLLFTWTLQEGKSLDEVSDLRLEFFHRGQWTSCEASWELKKKAGLPSSALLCRPNDAAPTYGKYRWMFKLKGNEEPHSSNEFYLKRI